MSVLRETDIRFEATANENEYEVWMTDDELEELRRAAASHRDDLVIQLGGYVGFRAFEIPQIRPNHVKLTEDGEHYRLSVPKGKDTTGNRDTSLELPTISVKQRVPQNH